jgi:hypothetical protein
MVENKIQVLINMRKIVVVSVIITFLCSVTLFNIIALNSESGTLKLLGGDVFEKEIKYTSGGSDETSIYLELNKEATVISAEMSIKGSAHSGEYPKNVEVDVGSDGDNEWEFIGEGYGRLGQQTTFSNDKEYQSVKFNIAGFDRNTNVLIPKDASITKANLTIKGFFGGEAYIATIDYYGDIYYTESYPDGTFGTPQMIENLANTYYTGCGVADFDDDGDFDLIALHGSAGYNFKNVYYYEKIGSGPSFAPKRLVGQIYGYYPEDLAIGRFNNDEHMDFMGSGLYESKSRIYFGDGNGFFSMFETSDFNMYYSFGKSQGDLDKDGDVDIVIAGGPSSPYKVWWFKNNGNGHSFTPVDTGYTTGYNSGIVVADWDNDGNLDILKGDSGGLWYFMKNDGNLNPTFSAPVSTGVNTGGYPGWGDSYNFNSDDNMDLICSSSAQNGYLTAYLGNAGATFGNKIDLGDVGYYSMGVAAPKISDLGHVMNPTLDIGDDNSIDWSKPGEFSDTVVIDTTNILKPILNNPPSHIAQNVIKDDYGNEFYSIPFNFTSASSGYLGLEVGIVYDYKAKINQKPDGNLTTELNQLIKSIDPNQSSYITNVTIPVKVSTETAGKVTISDVDILFNLHPEFIKPILTIKINEDAVIDNLLNLNKHFDDPDLPFDKLTYTIDSNSEEDNIDIHTDYDQWLQVAPKIKHWYGRAEIVIRATDRYGEYALSNEFIIKSEPVEDNPDINEDRPLPDITIYEGGVDDSIDLDEMNYFYDPEGDSLFFVIEIDPKNEYVGEDISVSISSKNELVVKGLGDWYGNNVPVWVYCDDDKDVKTLDDGNYVHQEILVHVLPINDPPYWTEIPEIKIPEDSPDVMFTNVLNLSHYAFDIDNDPEELRFELQYNSNEDIKIKLRENNSIDIEVEPDFFGTGTVGMRVYDNDSFGDTTFKVNILPVNDPPSITIDSHVEYEQVAGLTTLFGTAMDVENDLQYVRIKIGLDGNWQYLTSDFNNWRYKWDTTKWDNGVYLVIAEVYDGEYFDDTTVNLTVVISLNTPPTVDILTPEDGSKVEKTININGTANDIDGTVNLVEIRIDNVGSWLLCDGTDTWEFSLNTRSLSKGQHSIVARSYDGNSYSAIDSITINVDDEIDETDDETPIPVLGEGDEAVLMSFILIIIIIIIILAVIGFTVMKARERRRAEAEVKAIAETEEAARQKEAAEKAAEPDDKSIDFEKYKFATPLALPAFTSEEDEPES